MKTKMKFLKPILGVCLCLAILFSCVPLTVFASESYTLGYGKTAELTTPDGSATYSVTGYYGSNTYSYENEILLVMDGGLKLTAPQGRTLNLGVSDDLGGVSAIDVTAMSEEVSVEIDNYGVYLSLSKGESFVSGIYTYTCTDGTVKLELVPEYGFGAYYGSDGILTITGQGSGNVDVFDGYALAEEEGYAAFELIDYQTILVGGSIRTTAVNPGEVILRTGSVTAAGYYSPSVATDEGIYLTIDEGETITFDDGVLTDIVGSIALNFPEGAEFKMNLDNGNVKTIHALTGLSLGISDDGTVRYKGEAVTFEDDKAFLGTIKTETYNGLTITGDAEGFAAIVCTCDTKCETENYNCPVCIYDENYCRLPGTVIVFTKNGTYTLSGAGENVSIINEQDGTIVLNDVTITAPEGMPAINDVNFPLEVLVNGTNHLTGGNGEKFSAINSTGERLEINNTADGGTLYVTGAGGARGISAASQVLINNTTVHVTGSIGISMNGSNLIVGKGAVLYATGLAGAGIYNSDGANGYVCAEDGGSITAQGGEGDKNSNRAGIVADMINIEKDSSITAIGGTGTAGIYTMESIDPDGTLTVIGGRDADGQQAPAVIMNNENDQDIINYPIYLKATEELKAFTVLAMEDSYLLRDLSGTATLYLRDYVNYVDPDGYDVCITHQKNDVSKFSIVTISDDGTITGENIIVVSTNPKTENTEKVKDVTAENVTPEDKTDLEKAKADLEKALEDYGDNYTDDEKKAIEDEIKRIDDALEVIENVENVEELIGKIPENITKNDEAAIKAADDALGALTDYEKSLVDEDAKKALDDAKAALAELNKSTNPNSPQTGDNRNLWLWFALLFVSGGALFTLTVVDKKKKQ